MLATIVAAPITMALIKGVIACGVSGTVGIFVSKRLSMTAKKHEDIKILAMSKLNTISDLVSTALCESHISDDEFKLIKNKVDRYNKLKYEIQSKARKNYKEITISDEENIS